MILVLNVPVELVQLLVWLQQPQHPTVDLDAFMDVLVDALSHTETQPTGSRLAEAAWDLAESDRCFMNTFDAPTRIFLFESIVKVGLELQSTLAQLDAYRTPVQCVFKHYSPGGLCIELRSGICGAGYY